jgi:hypothetical protein
MQKAVSWIVTETIGDVGVVDPCGGKVSARRCRDFSRGYMKVGYTDRLHSHSLNSQEPDPHLGFREGRYELLSNPKYPNLIGDQNHTG